MFFPQLVVFVVFVYCRSVQADYIIDDSDYSALKFSEALAGPGWESFGSDDGELLKVRLPNGTTAQTVDATQCYDGTYTYAPCRTSDNCVVQFSFTGTGITIYVLQAGSQGMSASLSVDSGTPTPATLKAPSAPHYYTPDVVLFDVQNIPSGTHTAVMTVLDWDGSFSAMMLDYIVINQAVVASPYTSREPGSSLTSPTTDPTAIRFLSSLPTPTTDPKRQVVEPSLADTRTGSGVPSVVSFAPPFQSSRATTFLSSTPSGDTTNSTKTSYTVVVGSAVGGTGSLIVISGLVFFCLRRCRRRLQTVEEIPSPFLSPQPTKLTCTGATSTDAFGNSVVQTTMQFPGRPLHLLLDLEEGGSTLHDGQDSQTQRSPRSTHTHGAWSASDSVTSPVSASAGSPMVPPPTYQDEKARSGVGTRWQRHNQSSSASVDVRLARTNVVLTDEQADFIHGLFNNHVPAQVVAQVLERMIANRQGTGSPEGDGPNLRAHVNRDVVASSGSPRQMSTAGSAPWLLPTASEIEGETAPPSYYESREASGEL